MSHNIAAWLPGVGKRVEIKPADKPVPKGGELLIQVIIYDLIIPSQEKKYLIPSRVLSFVDEIWSRSHSGTSINHDQVEAVAVQPAEYKIQEGILPFPLTYPTIIGLSFSGVVIDLGAEVTRFSKGDRVVTNSAGSIRNDARFGAYQRYALTTQELTAKIGNLDFATAASVSNIYGAASALFIHLRLERPIENTSNKKTEKVLIWGASSSFGAFATQLASEAGYVVIGVASAHNEGLVRSYGADHFINRKSQTVSEDIIKLGPFKAVLAASDSAQDQITIGNILAAHGGGSFLSTMGLRKGVTLPPGVEGHFTQYLDDYLDPKNKDYTRWLWWQYLENALQAHKLKLPPVRVLGGLNQVQEAWDLLKEGSVSGERLIISVSQSI